MANAFSGSTGYEGLKNIGSSKAPAPESLGNKGAIAMGLNQVGDWLIKQYTEEEKATKAKAKAEIMHKYKMQEQTQKSALDAAGDIRKSGLKREDTKAEYKLGDDKRTREGIEKSIDLLKARQLDYDKDTDEYIKIQKNIDKLSDRYVRLVNTSSFTDAQKKLWADSLLGRDTPPTPPAEVVDDSKPSSISDYFTQGRNY